MLLPVFYNNRILKVIYLWSALRLELNKRKMCIWPSCNSVVWLGILALFRYDPSILAVKWIASSRKKTLIVTTPTTTQHNLNTVVGLDMKMTVQTPPSPPNPSPTTQTQQQSPWAPWASEQHSLMTTKYSVISNSKQGHNNNNNNNNNNDNNNINKKIISLRLTFIDHN